MIVPSCTIRVPASLIREGPIAARFVVTVANAAAPGAAPLCGPYRTRRLLRLAPSALPALPAGEVAMEFDGGELLYFWSSLSDARAVAASPLR